MTVSISILFIDDSHKVSDLFNLIKCVQSPSIRSYETYNFFDLVSRDFKDSKSMFFSSKFMRRVEIEDSPDIAITWGDECPDDYQDFMVMLLSGRSVVDHPAFHDFNMVKLQQVKEKRGYEIETAYDKPRDWMFYQVTRPNENVPYTLIVKEYSVNGMEPFFAFLYKAQSWGIMMDDFKFLQAIWKEYAESEYLEGELDFKKHKELVEKYTKKCLPSKDGVPWEEPDIFRKPIKDLVRFVERSEETDEEPPKKIKAL